MRLRASLLLSVLILTHLSISAAGQTMNESPFAVLSGLWRITDNKSGCVDSVHGIIFSDDRSKMFVAIQYVSETSRGALVVGESEEYRVLQTSPHLQVKRTDVVTSDIWELIISSRDHYCWHPTDFPAGYCDRTFDRCKH